MKKRGGFGGYCSWTMSFTLDKSLSKKRENVIDKSDAVDKR